MLYNCGMDDQYTVSAARAELPRILDAVAHGTDVKLTRQGQPVAVVVSTQRYEQFQAGAGASFMELCRAHRAKWGDVGLVDDAFVADLRGEDAGREPVL